MHGGMFDGVPATLTAFAVIVFVLGLFVGWLVFS